jgi:hypothetical protein
LAKAAGVAEKNPHLTVFDPTGRARILPRHPNRMAALLQKTRLIHNQNPRPVAKGFERIAANLIAQGLRIPMAAPQKRLHPPGPLQARLLGHQPARLALNARK